MCNCISSKQSSFIFQIEKSEQKTRDLYNNIDDVTTWLDTTENLIDTYENHEKQSDDQDMPKDSQIQEEMVHVVEDILVCLTETKNMNICCLY